LNSLLTPLQEGEAGLSTHTWTADTRLPAAMHVHVAASSTSPGRTRPHSLLPPAAWAARPEGG
jgi:hypothetical protein